MGSSPSAHVVFGVGWASEEAPPGLEGEYGWDYDAALALHPALNWDDELMDEDNWDEGEWVTSLIKSLGYDKLLDWHYVGHSEYGGSSIYVKRTRQWSSDYGLEPLSLVPPDEHEHAAIVHLVTLLGYKPDDARWRFFACYG